MARKLRQLKKKVVAAAAEARKLQAKAKTELAKARVKFRAAERKTTTFVRTNPKKALAIAAALGAALGAGAALAARGLRRKKRR